MLQHNINYVMLWRKKIPTFKKIIALLKYFVNILLENHGDLHSACRHILKMCCHIKHCASLFTRNQAELPPCSGNFSAGSSFCAEKGIGEQHGPGNSIAESIRRVLFLFNWGWDPLLNSPLSPYKTDQNSGLWGPQGALPT